MAYIVIVLKFPFGIVVRLGPTCMAAQSQHSIRQWLMCQDYAKPCVMTCKECILEHAKAE